MHHPLISSLPASAFTTSFATLADSIQVLQALHLATVRSHCEEILRHVLT